MKSNLKKPLEDWSCETIGQMLTKALKVFATNSSTDSHFKVNLNI